MAPIIDTGSYDQKTWMVGLQSKRWAGLKPAAEDQELCLINVASEMDNLYIDNFIPLIHRVDDPNIPYPESKTTLQLSS